MGKKKKGGKFKAKPKNALTKDPNTKREKKKFKRKQRIELEEEEELYEDDEEELEYYDENNYKDYFISESEMENAPHDKFDTYAIPRTKEEHMSYINNDLIPNCHIIIEVLDIRNPEVYRNELIEKDILQKDKSLVLLFNKTDLVTQEYKEAIKEKYEKDHLIIFTSGCIREEIDSFINEIRKVANLHKKKHNIKDETVIVGIIGYPNTGKESLINGLKLRSWTESPHFTRKIYFNEKELFAVESLFGTIMLDEIDEANENYSSFIPKCSKDIKGVTSPKAYIKNLLSHVDIKAIEKRYEINESIRSIEQLLKLVFMKYSDAIDNDDSMEENDKAALIVIRDIINGRITYNMK